MSGDATRCDVLVVGSGGAGMSAAIAAREAGLEFDHKAVSLNALLMGQAEDQLKAAKLPMFKSVGAGIQDVVCAEMVYRLAEEAGKLIPLPIEFYTKS